MLVVSSIWIAAATRTQVSTVEAEPNEVDVFNDRTDGQFRRRGRGGSSPSVPQGLTSLCPQKISRQMP